MLAQQRYLAAISNSSNNSAVSVVITNNKPKVVDDANDVANDSDGGTHSQHHRLSNYRQAPPSHVVTPRTSSSRSSSSCVPKDAALSKKVTVVPSVKRGVGNIWNHTPNGASSNAAVASKSTSSWNTGVSKNNTSSTQHLQTQWNSHASGIGPISSLQKQNIVEGGETDQQDNHNDDNDDMLMIQSRNGSTSPSRIRPVRAIMPSVREADGLGLSYTEEEAEEGECHSIILNSKDGKVSGIIHSYENQDCRRDCNEPQNTMPIAKCPIDDRDKDLNFVSVKSRLKQWNHVETTESPNGRISIKSENANVCSSNVLASPSSYSSNGKLKTSGGCVKQKSASKSVPVCTVAETKLGVKLQKQSSTVTGTMTRTTSLIGQNYVERDTREKQQKEKSKEPAIQSQTQSHPQPLQKWQKQQQQQKDGRFDSLMLPSSAGASTKTSIKQRALVFGGTVGYLSQSRSNCEGRLGYCNVGDCNLGDVSVQDDRAKQKYPTFCDNVQNPKSNTNQNCNDSKESRNKDDHHDKNVTNIEEKGKASSDDNQNRDSIQKCITKATDGAGTEIGAIAAGGVKDIRSLFEAPPEKKSTATNHSLKRTSNSKACLTNGVMPTTFRKVEMSKEQGDAKRDIGVNKSMKNDMDVMETENEPQTLSSCDDPCQVGAATRLVSFGKRSITVSESKVNLTINAPSIAVCENAKLPVSPDIKGEKVTMARDISASRGFNMLRSKFESISNNQGTSDSLQHDSVMCRNSSRLSKTVVNHIDSNASQVKKHAAVLTTDEKNSITSRMETKVSLVNPPSKIGQTNNSAFEKIRNRFNGEKNHSKSPEQYRPDNSLVQFVNSQRKLKQSFFTRDSSKLSQPQPHSQLIHNQTRRTSYETHRNSAFNVYNATLLKTSTTKDRDDDIKHENHDVHLLPPNDIPWKQIEPNDIPWTDRELLEERERSFTTQKVDMSFSYGAEYLDYSYEDDDGDGVTLCPTASDVSTLSVPSCLRSVDASSETSYASRTSDEDTGAMESLSEKQSTTLGPSEASSSQTSEAAAPLIHSTLGAMSMRFASSSDTTGTFSYNGAQFNALLGALPPPIDGEESDDNSDDLVFQKINNKCYNYESNMNFEDELNFQSGPKWKNDFFAVDSVKSLPTVDSAEVADWVPFPTTDSSGKDALLQTTTKTQVKKEKEKNSFQSSVQRLVKSGSKYVSMKSTSYPTQEARLTSPTHMTQSSDRTSRVESAQSDTENRVPKPNDIRPTTEAKLGTGAYRRFDVHRVRAFQQARRNKSSATT
eukprot:CAMPEP_0176496162 /NCGR_PEP_ID=MMETSP0200_2-20121128/11051_1 /TAXON_ID=947934 /ORGANISM="Chaetoceros sp., Strain GSL56" /LENGTH=1272 /DNA_ID=CAMNT_0017894105 /DNA_START=124 /DNA_END=3942 /DNA_ORIENTATION=+